MQVHPQEETRKGRKVQWKLVRHKAALRKVWQAGRKAQINHLSELCLISQGWVSLSIPPVPDGQQGAARWKCGLSANMMVLEHSYWTHLNYCAVGSELCMVTVSRMTSYPFNFPCWEERGLWVKTPELYLFLNNFNNVYRWMGERHSPFMCHLEDHCISMEPAIYCPSVEVLQSPAEAAILTSTYLQHIKLYKQLRRARAKEQENSRHCVVTDNTRS